MRNQSNRLLTSRVFLACCINHLKWCIFDTNFQSVLTLFDTFVWETGALHTFKYNAQYMLWLRRTSCTSFMHHVYGVLCFFQPLSLSSPSLYGKMATRAFDRCIFKINWDGSFLMWIRYSVQLVWNQGFEVVDCTDHHAHLFLCRLQENIRIRKGTLGRIRTRVTRGATAPYVGALTTRLLAPTSQLKLTRFARFVKLNVY